jgi:hypothetical protein
MSEVGERVEGVGCCVGVEGGRLSSVGLRAIFERVDRGGGGRPTEPDDGSELEVT